MELYSTVTLAFGKSQRRGTIVEINTNLPMSSKGYYGVIWDDISKDDTLCGSSRRYFIWRYSADELRRIKP